MRDCHVPLSYYLAFPYIYGDIVSSLPRGCEKNIMGYKILCFGLICILFAFYIYTPMPENIEEPWKVRIMDAATKATSLMVTFSPGNWDSLIQAHVKFLVISILKMTFFFRINHSNIINLFNVINHYKLLNLYKTWEIKFCW